MATLKSFELKGNKKSFANWISNLSPCDSPFTSMIGKEAIDQTQYSWQTDKLAPATIEAFEEGSQAESQPRAETQIVTNFTSILRKVASVSDTVNALNLYGRQKEQSYQLAKAGKELKRDLEFMNLNNDVGNVGTSVHASKFSGFAALCAQSGDVDVDTGAKTYKAVEVADLKGPWFKTSDLFDLTYNLYLAGAKANKIMFHPMHANTFSDFMCNNIETGKVYRMFDDIDTKYNAQVTKIRDPLGQVYDLIPNRFMPKNKVFIFNEADWTQMILRTPAMSKLSKQGSSERFLLETEVGLRHRHVNASGVMDMVPSNFIAEWIQKPTPLTWGLDAGKEAIVKLTDRRTGATVPDTTEVKWSSSNPSVILIQDPTGHTNNGQANVLLKPLRAGTSIITAYNKDGSATYLATVKDPGIKLTLSNNLMEKDGKVLAIVKVTDASGVGIDNVTVNFTANPFSLVNMPAKSAVTAGGGVANVEVNAANTIGLVEVQASVGEAKSNTARLDIVEKVQELIMRIDQRVITHGVNDSSEMSIMVVDAAGTPIANQEVSIASTEPTVIDIANSPINTGPTGVYTLRLTAAGLGSATITSLYDQQTVDLQMNVTQPVIDLTGPTNVPENTPFVMGVEVTRSDGSELVGVDVSLTSVPEFVPVFQDVATDGRGMVRFTYTPTSNSDLEVTAGVGPYKSNVLDIVVGS